MEAHVHRAEVRGGVDARSMQPLGAGADCLLQAAAIGDFLVFPDKVTCLYHEIDRTLPSLEYCLVSRKSAPKSGSSALRSGVAASDCRYEQELETEEEEASEYDAALQSDEELEEADLEEDVPEHDDELEDLEVEQDEEEEPLAVEYVGGPRVNLRCSEMLGPRMLDASGEAEYEKMADEDLWNHMSTP